MTVNPQEFEVSSINRAKIQKNHPTNFLLVGWVFYGILALFIEETSNSYG